LCILAKFFCFSLRISVCNFKEVYIRAILILLKCISRSSSKTSFEDPPPWITPRIITQKLLPNKFTRQTCWLMRSSGIVFIGLPCFTEPVQRVHSHICCWNVGGRTCKRTDIYRHGTGCRGKKCSMRNMKWKKTFWMC
jgi:hypothetical protein